MMETQEIFDNFKEKFSFCRDIGYSDIAKCKKCGEPLFVFEAYSGIGISKVGVCPKCGREQSLEAPH